MHWIAESQVPSLSGRTDKMRSLVYAEIRCRSEFTIRVKERKSHRCLARRKDIGRVVLVNLRTFLTDDAQLGNLAAASTKACAGGLPHLHYAFRLCIVVALN